MRVLVHEPNHSGHRFTTVRVLIEALLELNQQSKKLDKVTLATTEQALESDEYREQLQPLADNFEIYVLPKVKESSRPLIKTHRQLMGLRHCLKNTQIDHLYLPYTDFQLQLLTIYRFLPGINWWPPKPVVEVQLMLCSFPYSFGKKSRKFSSLMAVKHSGSNRVHLNDPLAIEYLAKHYPNTLSYVKGIPDPITQTVEIEKETARSFFQLPEDARIIGCLGVINERKGADVLVKSFCNATLRDTDILLLAGRLSPELKRLVDHYQDPRIVCLDRYLTEEELSNAISAMDLVVTPYSKQVVGSASIVIRAAVCNRMVLSSDIGWTGTIVPAYKLGLTSDVDDLLAFSGALEQAIEEAPGFQPKPAARNFVRYNSEQNVKQHWTALIRSRLNMSSQLVGLHGDNSVG